MHLMPLNILLNATTIARHIPNLYMRYKIMDTVPLYTSFKEGSILSQRINGLQFCVTIHYLFLVSGMYLRMINRLPYTSFHCMLQGQMTLFPDTRQQCLLQTGEYITQEVHLAPDMQTFCPQGTHVYCSIQPLITNNPPLDKPVVMPDAAYKKLLAIIQQPQSPGSLKESLAQVIKQLQTPATPATEITAEAIHPQFTTIYKVKEFLQNNYSDNISIKQLSQQFTTNEYRLKKDFKTAFGTSIHNFVIHQRIHNAKKLLMKSNLSVEEIATATGFYDHAHFSKKFKSSTGYSPSSFQEQVKDGMPDCF
ncbi:AraC-type DNA-binding protein [Filimonas lacunae]|uniref:AraC-type DNA-binding protein n=1 Tax=Filimonas lacunae TaxID=477680 RepID=A0A173MHR8_9BACT|nr:AraC family transcriptional regulator [Filimonas lacunae]BAV07164.1 transcriptional regulator, AraC family [Filimonas lacunae]SIS94001.1 AraC-type DNA-binding protein [Filimonas lacunae]